MKAKPNVVPKAQGKARVSTPIVVGIGASAGGFEAFKALLSALKSDTGMAFVLVQHLERSHKSLLTKLLSHTTKMRISEITDGQRIEANGVYVIPPNAGLSIKNGLLRLSLRSAGRGVPQTIDDFFSSLAADCKHRAIGVVLSGTGADGTIGLEAIKAAGGLTLAQAPESARSDAMPNSAIASGVVDFVLSPEQIALQLSRFANDPYLGQKQVAKGKARSGNDQSEDGFSRILYLLHDAKGVDFSQYRATTVRRRIERRILLDGTDSPLQYSEHLRAKPQDLELLYQDLLIGVTSFFRDPEAFECLQTMVFPKLIKNRATDEAVRIWVSGCSTGQEAYSFAMLYLEFMAHAEINLPLQIFATDLNAQTLEKARIGWYSKTAVQNLSPERLKRFFTEHNGGYRISEAVRERVIFARQNVFSDPPFSRMDIVSCRNLLIYLEPDLQSRVIPTLHYALKPNGVLMLGASESIGRFDELFTTLNHRSRLYSKLASTRRVPALERRITQAAKSKKPLTITQSIGSETEMQREADRLLLRYAPASVVVNDALEVVQFRGSTGQFLEPPTGKASFNLLRMAREGLMLPLRALTQAARQENRAVRQESLQFRSNGQSLLVNLEVLPLQRSGFLLVLFEVVAAKTQSKPSTRHLGQTRQVDDLSRELLEVREYLRFIQDQAEDDSESLQANNAELQSSSEELQSLNEELETAKEELESSGEEMQTLNDELTQRNTELANLNTILTNFQTSAELAIVAVGPDLRVQRFTPQSEQLLGLRNRDLGQPVGDLRYVLNTPDLEQMIQAVLNTREPTDREVRDRDGRWFLLRIRPSYALENQVNGAVLVLFEMDALKRAELERERLQKLTEAVFESLDDGLIALDFNWNVTYVNAKGASLTRLTPESMLNLNFWQLFPDALGTVFEDSYRRAMTERMTLAFEAYYAHLETRFEVKVVPIEAGITLFFSDVSERHRTEIIVAETKEQLRVLAESQRRFLADAAHELRAPLAVIQGNLEILERFPEMPVAQRSEAISDSSVEATRLGSLTNDLLSLARGDAGDGLHLEPLELGAILKKTLKELSKSATGKQLKLGEIQPSMVLGDHNKLKQLLLILLNNALQYSPKTGIVRLELKHIAGFAEIRISDSGQGIAPEELERVFERFYRTDVSRTRQTGGTGLGLPIARWITEQHHGKVWLESQLGIGTTAVVQIPLQSKQK